MAGGAGVRGVRCADWLPGRGSGVRWSVQGRERKGRGREREGGAGKGKEEQESSREGQRKAWNDREWLGRAKKW